MKLYSRVGIEPTFLHKSHYISKWVDHERVIKEIKHYWKKNAYNDEGVLEFPSPIYNKYEDLKNDYISLVSELNRKDYVPSSVRTMEEQGNCHINFDFKSAINGRNLVCFLNNYPSVVWGMLAANDNVSALIKTELGGYSFDKMVVFRNNIRHFNTEYLEMRFFKQPKTDEEFESNINLANQILLFTTKKRKFDLKNRSSDLKRYTFGKAYKELKEACSILEVPLETFDINQLELRFSYGKDYLV